MDILNCYSLESSVYHLPRWIYTCIQPEEEVTKESKNPLDFSLPMSLTQPI